MKNRVIITGNVRFSVLCEGVIRMEYAEDGAFCDAATLFASRGGCAEISAEIYRKNGVLYIETEKITLRYAGDGTGNFCTAELSADIHAGGVNNLWRYGDKSSRNLGGTLSTLDGVQGTRALPDGLLSRDGWYVIDDSASPVFTSDGWIAERDGRHITDKYLFAYGSDYKAALRDLCAVSGKAALPRKYFFGSWYSRWWRYTAEDFLSIVDEYDENGFPLDIMVMDMDWHYQDWHYEKGDPRPDFGYGHAEGNLGWTGYSWDRRAIPEPEALLDKLAGRGITVTLNDHPADGVRDTDEVYPAFMKELRESGYTESVALIPERQSQREKERGAGRPENFRFNAGSREYMRAFFDAHTYFEKQGAAFWWLDWQQDYLYPTVNGYKSLTHLKWLNHLYYEHSREGGRRGMSFSRWGGFGDQKYPAYFSGDAVTDWKTLEFEIGMTVSAGNAGCFFWSHDIGGFEDRVPGGQAEVYVRWVQFGAVSAALRLHVCGSETIDRRPWTWGEPFCSAMRAAFRLRSELLPYIYSSAYLSHSESLPLTRPMYFDFPETDEAYRHPTQFMLGDCLLCAPVTHAGTGENFSAESEIWLPEGEWYDCFTGKRYAGGGTAALKNDLYSFPLFQRAGVPVVTQAYTPRMTGSPLTQPIIRIFAGVCERVSETGVLYEDDGISEGFISGAYRRTLISFDKSGERCTITFSPEGNGFVGEAESRELKLILCDCEEPESIECNKKTAASYDSGKRQAEVSVSGVGAGEHFVLKLRYCLQN